MSKQPMTLYDGPRIHAATAFYVSYFFLATVLTYAAELKTGQVNDGRQEVLCVLAFLVSYPIAAICRLFIHGRYFIEHDTGTIEYCHRLFGQYVGRRRWASLKELRAIVLKGHYVCFDWQVAVFLERSDGQHIELSTDGHEPRATATRWAELLSLPLREERLHERLLVRRYSGAAWVLFYLVPWLAGCVLFCPFVIGYYVLSWLHEGGVKENEPRSLSTTIGKEQELQASLHSP